METIKRAILEHYRRQGRTAVSLDEYADLNLEKLHYEARADTAERRLIALMQSLRSQPMAMQ